MRSFGGLSAAAWLTAVVASEGENVRAFGPRSKREGESTGDTLPLLLSVGVTGSLGGGVVVMARCGPLTEVWVERCCGDARDF